MATFAAMDIAQVVLEGEFVRLEPLAGDHLAGLAEALRDGELWTNPFTFVPSPGDLPRFLQDADSGRHEGRELAFAIVDRASGAIVGSTRFRAIVPHHRKLEIGFTFIASAWQRTYVNTETKYLMLRYAFECWQCNRVEFLTDALNAPSRAAIERLGASHEGLLRSHYVMPGGRVRDTVVYSVVAAEWGGVRSRLESRLRAG